jgi:hypothetical protein
MVRGLVGAALLAALLASVLASTPKDLPTVALGQVGLYRLEIALLVFYGSLAMLTPAFSELAAGRLPIEISTRGARFAQEAEQSVGEEEVTIKELELTTQRLREALAAADIEIGRQRDKDVTTHDERYLRGNERS